MAAFTKVLMNESKKVNNQKPPLNRPGNCPEYLIWPVICWKGVGKDKSLCFNMAKEAAYRCCQECPSVGLNRGVDPGPTGFFGFRTEFGLRFV